jgi:hypothetical protein
MRRVTDICTFANPQQSFYLSVTLNNPHTYFNPHTRPKHRDINVVCVCEACVWISPSTSISQPVLLAHPLHMPITALPHRAPRILTQHVRMGVGMVGCPQVGDGVYGFTLDTVIGEFVMSHERIQIPDPGQRIYSGNQGNIDLWAPELKKYVEEVLQAGPKPYTYRYIGAYAIALSLPPSDLTDACRSRPWPLHVPPVVDGTRWMIKHG